MMTHAGLIAALLPCSYAGLVGDVMAAEVIAEGAALDAVQQRGGVLLDEMSPATSTELLARYESWLGLPNALYITQPKTVAERRAVAAALWHADGWASVAALQWQITAAGYAATVEETADAWVLRVVVIGDPRVRDFEAGYAVAGDALGDVDVHPVEALLAIIVPAHCRWEIFYSPQVDRFDALHYCLHVTYPDFFGVIDAAD